MSLWSSFAYISWGRLLVRFDGGSPQEIESPFAAGYTARSTAIARRNAWNSRGRGANMLMGMGSVPEEALEGRIANVPIHFTGLSRGRDEAELVYSAGTRIACIARGTDGRSHVALTDDEGANARQITDGDSIDTAPSWSDGRTVHLQRPGESTRALPSPLEPPRGLGAEERPRVIIEALVSLD